MLLLTAAARIEAGSLLMLLANLARAHWDAASSPLGPVRGCAYLLVLLATILGASAPAGRVLLALVPGVGGLLVLRGLSAEPTP